MTNDCLCKCNGNCFCSLCKCEHVCKCECSKICELECKCNTHTIDCCCGESDCEDECSHEIDVYDNISKTYKLGGTLSFSYLY